MGQNNNGGGNRKKPVSRHSVAVPAVLLIVIVAALFANFAISSKQAVKKAGQVLLDSVGEQATTLEAVIDEQFTTLEVLAGSVTSLDDPEPGYVVSILSRTVENSPFLHLFYTMTDGTSYVDNGMIFNVSQRDYFKVAMSGQRTLERLDSSMAKDEPRLVLAVPMIRGNEIIGVMQASYNENMLRDLIISKAYGGEAYSVIYNMDGEYRVGSDSPYSVLTGDNLFTALKSAKLGGVDSVDQLREKVQSGESGTFTFELSGQKRYAVYIPLDIYPAPGGQWFMLNILPYSVIENEVNRDTQTSSALLIIVMLISVTALMYIVIRERKSAKELARDHEQLRISEEQFRVASQLGGRGVARYDIKGRAYHNDNGPLLFQGFDGVIPDAPKTFISAGIVANECGEDFTTFFEKIESGQPSCSTTVALKVPDGSYRWFNIEATISFDGSKKPSQAILVFTDTTDQREKEAVYKKWQQSLEEKNPEAYTLFRGNLSRGTLFDASEGALLKIQFSPDSDTFNLKTADYVGKFVHPDDAEEYSALLNSNALLAKYFRGKRSETLEYREQLADGRVRWIRVTIEMVEYPNSKDVEIYMMYEDIDEAKRAELLATEKAETDVLTGVLNRAAFVEKLEDVMESSKADSQHVLMMLDIDGFKMVNDSFGHAVGDEALMDVAELLRSTLRHGDLLGRLGGDEFLICLTDMPYDAIIEKKAAQICALLRKSFSLEVQISASIGIAVFPRDGDSFETLYQNADTALYTVKNAGGNSYAFFSRKSGIGSEDPGSTSITAPVNEARRRILIVDDDEASREALSSLFVDEYTVDTAGDGRAALIKIRHFGASISAILLDLQMPGMDGYAVLEKMRGSVEMQSIPVIVMSSDAKSATNIKTLEYGASEYITKPFDPEIIRLRVNSAVSKAENEKMRAQKSYLLLQSNEETKYRTVLESTGTVVIEYDWLNGVFYYDPSISRHIAGSFDNRKLWHILLSDMVANAVDVRHLQELVHDIANDRYNKEGSLDLMLKTPNRTRHWFHVNVYKQTNEFQLTDKMILTFNDINEEVLSSERLHFQAERDELTELNNRRTFLNKVEEMVRSKPGNTYVISVGDIDSFKVVNDRFGHIEGDRLLKFVAGKLLADCIVEGGICGRMSSDIFAALLPFSTAITEKLNQYPQRLLSGYPLELRLTCSIGHFLIDDPEISADDMLDRASMARQSVKGLYGSQSAWYDEQMRKRLLAEQEITDTMEAALLAGQFDIYLHPQYNHLTGKICGVESLVRWLHPVKGVVSPNDFIPTFEKSGFITRLDEFVWDRTAKKLRQWLDSGGEPVPVSVNVSRLDTDDLGMCEKIVSIVEKYRIPIDLFRLEITESMFVADSERLISVVDELHKRGFLIEMDDFGSGYSSLNILKEVPVDILKLDMRFFSGTGSTERGGVILGAIMRMARWLNMPVIAEGVETLQQADFLASIGCSTIQGFLYAKPLPVGEFEQLLKKSGVAVMAMPDGGDTYTETRNLWNHESADSRLFNYYWGAAVVYEYQNGSFEALRANTRFTDALRLPRDITLPTRGLLVMHPEDIPLFRAAAEKAIETGADQSVTVRRAFDDGTEDLELNVVIRLLAKNFDSAIILCNIL